MANGTRTLTLVIVLVVGLAVGWFIGHGAPAPPPPPTPTPVPIPSGPVAGNHLIKVGPKAQEVGVVVSKAGKHKVFWIARGAPKMLEIRFKASDFPNGQPLFEGGQPGQDQVISCNPGGVCTSPDINGNLVYPPEGLYYKYWQTLGGETADAGIIIEK